MARDRSKKGRLLNDRYRLTEKLGEGGMGQIWMAEHLVLKAPVAVKIIDRQVVPDEETLERFMREAQAAAALRSPHVVQILDYGMDAGLPFMVMELLEGETLADRLKRQRRLGPAETSHFLTHVARAVGRAHEAGIVHRDLKPENVFIVHNDDEEIAKVLDFGVAKVQKTSLGPEGTRTRTGSLLGTPYYMSPEQAQGNKLVDARSDLWALAVMAFECLTGKRPFFSDGLGDLVLQICVHGIPRPSQVASVPLGFDAWFEKGTQRDPALRFQSAKELSDALREALGIEGRETYSVAGPDISVTSAPDSQASPGRSNLMPTARVSAYERPTLDGGEARTERVNAGTLEDSAPLSDTDEIPQGWMEKAPHAIEEEERQPAHTVQQFSTSHPSLPPRRGSTVLVWLVATAALALGGALGVFFVSQSELADPGRARPSRVRSELPRAAARPKSTPLVDSPSEESQSAPLTSASAAPSVELADGGSGMPEDDQGEEEPVDAGAASDASPDVWVKPAWAIPDDEPIVSDPLPKPKPGPSPRGSSATTPSPNPY